MSDQSLGLARNRLAARYWDRRPSCCSLGRGGQSEVVMMNKANNVVSMNPASRTTGAQPVTRESEKKWGKKVMALGFCVVPSLLLRAQQRLGLNPTQLAVLMQLCDHWWDSNRKPYPGKKALGQRLGLSPRQVQRHIAALETAGLVTRIPRRAAHGGKQTNIYDLAGLVERLKKLESDFRAVEEEAKANRKAVGSPRYPRSTSERTPRGAAGKS